MYSHYERKRGLCVSRVLPTLVKLHKYLTRNTIMTLIYYIIYSIDVYIYILLLIINITIINCYLVTLLISKEGRVVAEPTLRRARSVESVIRFPSASQRGVCSRLGSDWRKYCKNFSLLRFDNDEK